MLFDDSKFSIIYLLICGNIKKLALLSEFKQWEEIQISNSPYSSTRNSLGNKGFVASS